MTDIVYPNHEQHWPDHLIPHRIEEYVLDDGRPPTTNRAYAKKLTGQQVLTEVIRVSNRIGLKNIDPRYYVATCFHEAGCSNEWDTEIATQRSPNGFFSVGAYQIGREEAERFQFRLEDMLDLTKATAVMIRLAESNRAAIRSAAGIPDRAPDPDYTDPNGVRWQGGAVRAYLAIAHNQGVGAVRQTIKTYGLDWPAYKKRNPTSNIVTHNYGEDCVTGGPFWPSSTEGAHPPGSRTVKLADPRMTGEDVRELQRILKIYSDGIFGTMTDTAVRLYQRGHGLVEDGIVGPKTWESLLKT